MPSRIGKVGRSFAIRAGRAQTIKIAGALEGGGRGLQNVRAWYGSGPTTVQGRGLASQLLQKSCIRWCGISAYALSQQYRASAHDRENKQTCHTYIHTHVYRYIHTNTDFIRIHTYIQMHRYSVRSLYYSAIQYYFMLCTVHFQGTTTDALGSRVGCIHIIQNARTPGTQIVRARPRASPYMSWNRFPNTMNHRRNAKADERGGKREKISQKM